MSRHRDLVRLLSEARPRRLDPDPGRIDLAAIMSCPPDDPAGLAVRRASRRRLMLAAGLAPTLAAGVLAVAVVYDRPAATPPARSGPAVAQQPVPTEQPVPSQRPVTAQQFLLAAAEQVDQGAATSGRYWVRKIEDGLVRQVGPAGARYDVVERHGTEYWHASDPRDGSCLVSQHLGAVPATAADEAAWRRDGSPTRWTERDPDLPDPIVIEAAAGPTEVIDARPPRPRRGMGGTPRETFMVGGMPMTLAELSALPADPAALKAALLRARGAKGSVTVRQAFLFWSAKELLFDVPATPRVRAAAYRLLADLDGVTLLGPVEDRHGRAGMAVAYTRRGDGGNLVQIRLIVDPGTGQALAEESWDLGGSGAAPGKLARYTLVRSAGWTDEAPPEG
ncbi:CU044_5270 family protein [Micromonospora sp. LZ34]